MIPDTLEAHAQEFAGNHSRWQSFAWFARPEDSDLWGLWYTENRDSGVLEQSNAAAIARRLARYVRRGTVSEEEHSHWACGWVRGYAIRVYTRRGRITRAFREYDRIRRALDAYPILDEDDCSMRELDAAQEAWESASLRDRVELCQRARVSPLNARHPLYSDRQRDRERVEQYVRDSWVNL